MSDAPQQSDPASANAAAGEARDSLTQRLAEARRLMRQGKSAEAIEELDKAIEMAPRAPAAWRQKALILRQLGRVNQAVEVIDFGLSRIGKEDPDLLRDKAELHLLQDDFDRAGETFDRLIALDAGSVEAWLGKGRCLLGEGKPEEALTCAERAIALDRQSSAGHVLRGDILLALGRWTESFDAFVEASSAGGFYSSNWAARGDRYRENGQPELALAAYRRAQTADDKNPEGFHGEGVILRERGDVEGAVAAFAKASETDPEFVLGFLDAGGLCVEHNQLERALGYFEAATKVRRDSGPPADRNDPQPWMAIGWVHELKGGNEDAKTAYEQATRIAPDNAEAWNLLGNVLIRLDRIDEAERSYRTAIDKNPQYGWPHHNLAFVLMRQKRFADALAAAQEAIGLEPNNGDFRTGELIVRDATDEFDEAAAENAVRTAGADNRLRINAANFLAAFDKIERARDLLRGIEAADTPDSETRLSLGESLLLVGDYGAAAAVLTGIDRNLRDLSTAAARALLHLLADRLARNAPVSEPLLRDFLAQLQKRMAEVETRGREWGYLCVGWNFRGVRRVLLRSELPAPDRFALATLIDLAEGGIHPKQLSFLAEARA